MRGDEELCNHLKTFGGPLWKKLLLQTPFPHLHTQPMFSKARALDWLRSETLVSKIIQQWSGVTQSNIKEHCVREQRQSEINRVGPPLLAQPDQQEDRTSRRGPRLWKIPLHFAPFRITRGKEHRRDICRTPAEGPTGVQRDCVDEHACAAFHDRARAGYCSVRGVESLEVCKAHGLPLVDPYVETCQTDRGVEVALVSC